MDTEFSFKSTAFNCTQTREYFINPECFGDDLARWLIAKLNDRGIETMNEPQQEDFGWYFTFRASDVEHCLVLGFQPNDPSTGDQWLGWLERQAGFLSALTGGRKRGISPKAVSLIDEILATAPEIRDVKWEEHR
jgi:hypothetical protein